MPDCRAGGRSTQKVSVGGRTLRFSKGYLGGRSSSPCFLLLSPRESSVCADVLGFWYHHPLEALPLPLFPGSAPQRPVAMTTAQRDSLVWRLAGLLRDSGEWVHGWSGAAARWGCTLPSRDTLALEVIELQLFKVTRFLASIFILFYFFFTSLKFILWCPCLRGPLFLTFQTLAILRDPTPVPLPQCVLWYSKRKGIFTWL